jgi:hypothetical protein
MRGRKRMRGVRGRKSHAQLSCGGSCVVAHRPRAPLQLHRTRTRGPGRDNPVRVRGFERATAASSRAVTGFLGAESRVRRPSESALKSDKAGLAQTGALRCLCAHESEARGLGIKRTKAALLCARFVSKGLVGCTQCVQKRRLCAHESGARGLCIMRTKAALLYARFVSTGPFGCTQWRGLWCPVPGVGLGSLGLSPILPPPETSLSLLSPSSLPPLSLLPPTSLLPPSLLSPSSLPPLSLLPPSSLPPLSSSLLSPPPSSLLLSPSHSERPPLHVPYRGPLNAGAAVSIAL